jgi:hypothetical protein
MLFQGALLAEGFDPRLPAVDTADPMVLIGACGDGADASDVAPIASIGAS